MEILKLHEGVYLSPWNYTLAKDWDMKWTNIINGTNNNDESSKEEDVWKKIISFIQQNEVFGLGLSKTDIVNFLHQCPAPEAFNLNIGPTVYLTEEEENISDEQIKERLKKPISYNNEEDRDLNIQIMFSIRKLLYKTIPPNIRTMLDNDTNPGRHIMEVCLGKRISLTKAKSILQQLGIEIVGEDD